MTIYIIKNFTRWEFYLGIAEKNPKEAIEKHRRDPWSPLSHWRWDKEEIRWGEVEGDLPPDTAIAFLRALRREPPEEGWTLVYAPEEG
ncbi:MAG: hypothetical protein ACK4OO_00245 [bacterium]